MCFNRLEMINNKSIVNIKLNVEILKAFYLRTRQGYPFLQLLFNVVLEVLARALSQEKRIKKHPNNKGRSKIVSIFRLNDIVYRKP